MHGVKYFAAREVLFNLAAVARNENVDTVPRELWDRARNSLPNRG